MQGKGIFMDDFMTSSDSDKIFAPWTRKNTPWNLSTVVLENCRSETQKRLKISYTEEFLRIAL